MVELGRGRTSGKTAPLRSGGQIGTQDLERHVPVVPEIVGEVDGRHASLTDLALEPIAVGESWSIVDGRWSMVDVGRRD